MRLLQKIVNQCISCQCNIASYTRESYIMSPLQSAHWVEVSIDFKQLSQTQHLLVVTYDYSRYTVVESVYSTSSHHVIPVLDKIFTMFGVPETGRHFKVEHFINMLSILVLQIEKFLHNYHPRANGECERFMRTL